LVASLKRSIPTAVGLPGRVTVAWRVTTSSAGRITSIGENATKRAGKATCQRLAAGEVASPLVNSAWATAELSTRTSRSVAWASQMRLAGNHISR